MEYELYVKLISVADTLPENVEDGLKQDALRVAAQLQEHAKLRMLPVGGLADSCATITKIAYSMEKLTGDLTNDLVRSGTHDNILDEHVRDAAAHAASLVNNEGMEGQVRYLLQEIGREETQRIVNQITEKKDETNNPEKSEG